MPEYYLGNNYQLLATFCTVFTAIYYVLYYNCGYFASPRNFVPSVQSVLLQSKVRQTTNISDENASETENSFMETSSCDVQCDRSDSDEIDMAMVLKFRFD